MKWNEILTRLWTAICTLVANLLKKEDSGNYTKPGYGGALPVLPPSFSLPWSASDKSREAWTKKLIDLVTPTIGEYLKANDIGKLYPGILSLPVEKQVKAVCLFWCWVAYYESGWNKDSQSVDVGTKEDQDTWSIGPLQMSVVDQESYNIPMGLDFRKLLIPENNLELGHRIMLKQIKNYGKIFIPKGEKGLYWAVAHPGGRYDCTDKIVEHIKKGMV